MEIQGNASNLLLSLNNKVQQQIAPISVPQAAQTNNPVKIKEQLQQDTFENVLKEKPKTTFEKVKIAAQKYSGVAALAVTIIGLPAVYKLSKNNSKKLLNDVKGSVDNLSQSLGGLNLEDRIESAVKAALESIPKNTTASAGNPVSIKSALATALLGIGSVLGITEYVKNNKDELVKKGYSEDVIKDAEKTAIGIISTAENAAKKAGEVTGIVHEAKAVAYETRDKVNGYEDRINNVHRRADEVINAVNYNNNPIMSKYTDKYYGINLLSIHDYKKKINALRTEFAMDAVKNAATVRIKRTADKTNEDIKAFREKYKGKLDAVWSVTAEYKPIQSGGLGVVPFDLQNNFNRMGINSPVFVPMYLKNNFSEFKALPDGTYSYTFKDTFKLKKAAEMVTDVYRNGHARKEKVEYFTSEIPILSDSDITKILSSAGIVAQKRDVIKDGKKKTEAYYVKVSDNNRSKLKEKEKILILRDIKNRDNQRLLLSVMDGKTALDEAFNIKVDSNNEASLEDVNRVINEIRNMALTKPIIFVKNEDYFNGDLYECTPHAEEAERFAFFSKAVYNLAKHKVASSLGSDKITEQELKIFDKNAFDAIKAPGGFILNDWHAGAIGGLLRYKAPMEYNYNQLNEKETIALKDMPIVMVGHNLEHQGKSSSGLNTLLEKERATENVLNTLYDGYTSGIVQNANSCIFDSNISNVLLLNRENDDKQYNSLFAGIAMADWFVPVSKTYTREVINDMSKSGIVQSLLQARDAVGTISGTINGYDKNTIDMKAIATNNRVNGLKFEIYDENTPVDEVMAKRKENKRAFFNSFIQPLLAKNELSGMTLVDPQNGKLDISEQEFVDSPLISFAHRLDSQKGLEIFKGAVFRLFDNWDKEFKGKPLPVILVGGVAQDADQLDFLKVLKDPAHGKNKERVKRVIAATGMMPNPAIQAASTIFCAPSRFEPCGLTQAECYAKGTPVAVTDVGGFHDTVEEGVSGFVAKNYSEEEFYNALVRAMKTYFYDHDKYKQMVMHDLGIDLSWSLEGKQGPIYEYTDKLGYLREELPDLGASTRMAA